MTNNIPSSYDLGIYYFNIDYLSTFYSGTGYPAGWNYSQNSSATTWITTETSTIIPSGASSSEFSIYASDTTLPISIDWIVYARHSAPPPWTPYLEDDAFVTGNNPGFAGTASLVPVPSTVSLLALGLFCITGISRRKR